MAAQNPRDPRIRPMRPPTPKQPSNLPKIRVEANHFPVTFDMNTFPAKVYHYDVVITPKEPKDKEGNLVEDPKETTVPDRLLHVIWREFEERYHGNLGARMPFDGKKNCYTAKPLNLGGNHSWNTEIVMTDPDDDDKTRTYRIALQLTNEVSTASMFTYLRSCETWERCELPQDVIQALDVALRYCPSLHYTPCNRSFYSERDPHNLSDLLELWFGHNQSLLLGRDQMATLNVDMANKAFIKRLSVSRLMKIMLKKDDSSLTALSIDNLKQVEDFLKGKLIEYATDPGANGKFQRRHRYTAVRVTGYDSSFPFKDINGEATTIEQYFAKEKGVRLAHPNWPVVHVGNKNMTNFVPLELCHIIPQAFKGKLSPADTSEMIKGAAKPPTDRFKRIQNSADNCGFKKCPILKEFGVDVGTKMLTIDSAFKLPKPQLHFKNPQGREEHVEPKQDGKFQIGGFLKGAEVPKIGVLNACASGTSRNFERELSTFLRTLGEEARKMGMMTASKPNLPATSLPANHFSNTKIENVFARPIHGPMNPETAFVKQVNRALKMLKQADCGLILVIIGKDGVEYPTIKSEAEVQVGILTQCVKVTTVNKMWNPKGGKQVAINFLLKINALNFQLGAQVYKNFCFTTEPILILGADVTHPAPHSKTPSVAAITASYDLSGMAYQMHIQVQPRRQEGAAEEVITGFQDRVKEMLKKFRKDTQKKPERIIMFRDGVSEGQFPQIKEKEYGAIVAACQSLEAAYKPKITFLVVKKRHHTRFRPIKPTDGCPPKGNIPPGTCVDTVITHPTEMEYFLNSHVGIQGTSKPTRYHVIHDDNNFSMLELERLTYYLCYSFVRCTSPVSYPAPTYYAHLAAFRARALLENEGENADLSRLQNKLTIHPDLKNMYPMFYV